MAFEKWKDHTGEIQNQAQSYIENSIEYYKLWGFKVAMKSTTIIFKFVLIAMSVTMVLLFLSLACAFAIGEVIGSNALGFLIVAGFYSVVTIFLFLIKDKIAEGPILEKFSEIFFND